MQTPVSHDDAFEKIHFGRLIQVMVNTPGYVEVFRPMLTVLLNEADAKCHDFRLREDRGKYAIVEYNTIKKVMNFCDDCIKDMEAAIEYCEKEGIQP